MSGATENAATGQRKAWIHGSAIASDGTLRFTSVSALQMADAETETGCLRKWWFAYKQKIREPPNEHLDRGNAGHAEIARYLTTGQRSHLSSVVLHGFHLLPTPGTDLLVEHDYVPNLPDGTSGLENAVLRASGIPLLGAIDLIHGRPENPGSDTPDLVDEPGVVKVTDWKFPNTMNHALRNQDLINTIQMAGYAKWVFEVMPETTKVRIAHGYMPLKGAPRLPSALVTREQVAATWKRADRLAVTLIDAARQDDPSKVEPNTRACRAYGRTCVVKERGLCNADQERQHQPSLAQLMGLTASKRLSALTAHGDEKQMTAPTNLFAHMAAQRAATQASPAPVANVATVQSEIERLRALEMASQATAISAEEIERARVEAAARNAALALLDQIARIGALGLGEPAFAGSAAATISAAKGNQITNGAGIAGTGELGQLTLHDVAELDDLYAQVKGEFDRRAAETAAASVTTTAPPAFMPPDAPIAQSSAAPVVAAASTETAAVAPKRRGRPPKNPVAAPPVLAVSPLVPAVAAPATVAIAPVVIAPAVIAPVALVPSTPPITEATKPITNFYVDVTVSGNAPTPFWPIASELISVLNAEAGVPVHEDFRRADRDSKFAFGGWKPIIAAMLRETAAAGHLAGDFSMDSGHGEIGYEIIAAMRDIAVSSGGRFINGTR